MKGFTQSQENLMDYLVEVGYGYRQFAYNVREQGFCSPKQEETMIGMKIKIEGRRASFTTKYINHSDDWDMMEDHDYGSSDFH